MNISELINEKVKDFDFEKDWDTDIIIHISEFGKLGKSITKTFEIENDFPYIGKRSYRSLTVDGVEFRQDGRVATLDKEFIVWAVLDDKIILKMASITYS